MPTCRHCGGKRVGRYCAQCGGIAAVETPRSEVARPIVSPVALRSGRQISTLFGLVIFGLLALSLFLVRHIAVPPHPAQIALQDSLPMIIQPGGGLEMENTGRINAGRAGIYALGARMVSLRNDLERFAAERKAVVDLRQRFSQARLQAEDEGRWPTKAAGRSFDRAELKDVIDRTDEWLKRYEPTVNATESRLTQCGIAVGQADRILLSMRRIVDDLKSGSRMEMSRDDVSFRQEAQRKFQSLAAQLDRILADDAPKAMQPTLPPFDIDRLGGR